MKKTNYERIIKTSSVIGGAQSINMFLGLIRTKFIAVLLGPLGIGLLSTYQSIMQLISTIFSLGLQSSAVRDISKAATQNDVDLQYKLFISLKRICFLSGAFGSLFVCLLADNISYWTFNSFDKSFDISLLSIVILFMNLKSAHLAVLQGLQKINELAKVSIYGAFNATIITIPLYFFYEFDGIVPALVMISILDFIIVQYFTNKLCNSSIKISWRKSITICGGMFKLGLAFMWNGFLIAAVSYLIKTIIADNIDLGAVGIYAAAFGLSSIIVNFILSAMSADYYPSLTSISHDHLKMKDLVNQQTEIGILFAMPSLIATLAFSPLLIDLFYTNEFFEASNLLLWFSLGSIAKVISWPLGFIILAKGRSKLFVITETIISLVHLFLIVFLINIMGVEGVAFSYFILYLIHVVMMIYVSKFLIDFVWDKQVIKLIFLFTPIIFFVFISSYNLNKWESSILGLMSLVFCSLYSFKSIMLKIPKTSSLYANIIKIPFLKLFLKYF